DRDHYENFQLIYQSITTEQYRPTLITTITNNERAPSFLLVNTQNYSCESPFVPEDHILYNEVFVREKISCETPIELAYYSCQKSNINSNICYWCGYDNELAEPSESLKSKYKFLFPCCTLCRDIGKEFFVRGEIKTHMKATKK
ncbi:6037_t:CDS:2, partial [Cetraspora pellucida]